MVKNILFDFDGVILDSMPTREYGFRKIFQDYEDELIEELVRYHNYNGGLSRYVKIKYFYEIILKKHITQHKIEELAQEFSNIMKSELIKKKYLIQDTLNFIIRNHQKYNLHIVSGSDQTELRFLCTSLQIDKYFKTIFGSPTHKNELVKDVLSNNSYLNSETILIGDSINDYEAAKNNHILFFGFNNIKLEKISKNYIIYFNTFNKWIENE